MARFCIIGCGLTGAVTASILKQKLPDLNVVILEKSTGTGELAFRACVISHFFGTCLLAGRIAKHCDRIYGGRFCTSRSSFGSSVDLGAQYVTKTSSLSDVQNKCYSELLETGLLQPLCETVEGLKSNGGAENFICPKGSGSIVKHFIQSSGCEVLFGQRVTKLSPDGNKWKLSCENNSNFEFDAVILTIPVPQVLQIQGIYSYIQGKELENMRSIQYSSRFALGLFYDYQSKYFDDIPWISKYISNDNVVRFCSIDHKKRDSSHLPSVAIHTTKDFGKMHIDEDSSTVQNIIFCSLEKILPDLPNPSFIKFHKWRYSQVEKSYIGKPGCIIFTKEPLLIGGGDGFSYSTFEGCIYSSENIVKCIMKNF